MEEHSPSCHAGKKKVDILLWGSLFSVCFLYLMHWQFNDMTAEVIWLEILAESVFVLMNTVWWGILIGILMVAILSKIPRAFVMAILGEGGGFKGIIRATLGGVLLDLCSHGILMVAAKLYERGASIGQVVAFLIASPWNSFSLTLVLIALIGLPWTLAFIVLSMAVAIVTGFIFDKLVQHGKLPKNPNAIEIDKNFKFWSEAKRGLSNQKYNMAFFRDLVVTGLKESRMVLKWILFGVVMAGLVRAFINTESFEAYFGPTLAGLGLTILVATIMEVCSEGSTPIAADILNRGKSPGNSFAFLMTGVSTDYTEIMILRERTKSWKIALFLPLITLPQIIAISWLINVLA